MATNRGERALLTLSVLAGVLVLALASVALGLTFGNGLTAARPAAAVRIDVAGSDVGATAMAIAAGGGHTCALTSAGGVKCWGQNLFGQLGDGTTIDRTTPVDVAGLQSGVIAVAAGGLHTCALTAGGGVKCWGLNAFGEVGAATTELCGWAPSPCSTIPLDVIGFEAGVAAIAAGSSHTCAVTARGAAKCWGFGPDGQLGTPASDSCVGWGAPLPCSKTPADVRGLRNGVKTIDAGVDHSCALTARGGVKCWGGNFAGQLGDGTISGHTTPRYVVGLHRGVTSITTGNNYTCAVTTGGGVTCWGIGEEGQLGVWPANDLNPIPLDVAELGAEAGAVTAGGWHTCALTVEAGVKCWGLNTLGQIGDGTTDQRFIPVDVLGLGSGVAAIEAGELHTCALTTAGRVKCWGSNQFGQLGDGTTATHSTTPVDVVGFGP